MMQQHNKLTGGIPLDSIPLYGEKKRAKRWVDLETCKVSSVGCSKHFKTDYFVQRLDF